MSFKHLTCMTSLLILVNFKISFSYLSNQGAGWPGVGRERLWQRRLDLHHPGEGPQEAAERGGAVGGNRPGETDYSLGD